MPYRPDLILKEQGFDVEDGVPASGAEIESLEQLLEENLHGTNAKELCQAKSFHRFEKLYEQEHKYKILGLLVFGISSYLFNCYYVFRQIRKKSWVIQAFFFLSPFFKILNVSFRRPSRNDSLQIRIYDQNLGTSLS